AREAEIATRCRPLVGVLHSGKLLLIGACHRLAGQTHRHRDDGASQNSKLHIHVFLLSLATQFTERKLSSSLNVQGVRFSLGANAKRAPSPCVLQLSLWIWEAIPNAQKQKKPPRARSWRRVLRWTHHAVTPHEELQPNSEFDAGDIELSME